MTTVVNTPTSFHLMCEQKPIGKKQQLYERKSHQTKMADFILQGVRQTRTQALDLSRTNVRVSNPPQRTFPKHH